MIRQTIVVSLAALGAWCCAGVLAQGSDPETPQTITNSIGIRLRLIPAGEFLMGSPDSDPDALWSETPAHRVRITASFYLGVHEVTRGQFRKFVEAERYQTEGERDGQGGHGYDATTDSGQRSPEYTWRNPGFAQTDDHPVVNVSWNDAAAFAEWLSRKEGTRYRLPTEAEWEYACRAGTTTRWYHGNDEARLAQVGNLADASAKVKFPNRKGTIRATDGHVFTAPVGQFQANRFGLYDMHGNVWEWCQDRWGHRYYAASPTDDPPGASGGSRRVCRGGGWNCVTRCSRAAIRSGCEPSFRDYSLGFRLARVVSSSSPSRSTR